MNLDKALKDFGLSSKEIAVFTALLDIGLSDVKAIVTRSGVNRGTCYDVLESLEDQGLVVRSEQGKLFKFSSISPERLIQVLNDKRNKLEHFQKEIESNLPELMARFGAGGGKPKVSVWEGKSGIHTILADVLDSVSKLKVKEYSVFSSSGLRESIYKAMPEFSKERIKKGIKVKTIAIGDGGRLVGLDERKWLTKKEANAASTYELIYADKVAHISLSESGSPIGVIIQNPDINSTQKIIFQSLWERIK